MRQRFKIALLVREFVPSIGGLESWAHNLAQALAQHGHGVRVLTTRIGTEIDGVRCDLVARGAGPIQQARLFAAAALPGEIVHDTGVGLGGDVFQPQMGCHSLNIARDRAAWPWRARLRMLRDRQYLRHVREVAALERLQLAQAGRVVAVSREVERVFRKRFQVPQQRLVVIPNGIDIRHFNPGDAAATRDVARGRLGLAPDSLMLLSAAHNFRLKGVHHAIQALALLGPTLADAQLLVAGAGASAEFAALAERAGVASRVRFLGQVADMPALFAAADIFVHPTAHDACSLATLEAMACGVPVITTRRNGAADGMVSGREGWVLDAPDTKALAAALRIMADPVRREPMRAAARRFAERHDFNATVDQIEAVYSDVAGRIAADRHRKMPSTDDNRSMSGFRNRNDIRNRVEVLRDQDIMRPLSAGSLILAQFSDRLRERIAPRGSRREPIARRFYLPLLKLITTLMRPDLDLTAPPSVWTRAGVYPSYGNTGPVRSVLLIKVDHIGDFLLSLDAILTLRTEFPRARFTLVCDRANADLARALGLFDDVQGIVFFAQRSNVTMPPFVPDMLTGLAGQTFDVAIDLRVDGSSRPIIDHVEARFRFGFESRTGRRGMTLELPNPRLTISPDGLEQHQRLLMLRLAHSVIDFCRVTPGVAERLLASRTQAASVDLGYAEGKELVVCNTGSGRALKNWPVERFAGLIAWLCNERNAAVLLLGTAEQAGDATIVMSGCRPGSIASAVGDTTLIETIGLLCRASLYIGNDSGLTHLAARLGVATVALYSGVESPGNWAPVGPDVTVLHAPVSCSPCHIQEQRDCIGRRACLMNISEAFVREIVAGKLQAATPIEQRPVPEPCANWT